MTCKDCKNAESCRNIGQHDCTYDNEYMSKTYEKLKHGIISAQDELSVSLMKVKMSKKTLVDFEKNFCYINF